MLNRRARLKRKLRRPACHLLTDRADLFLNVVGQLPKPIAVDLGEHAGDPRVVGRAPRAKEQGFTGVDRDSDIDELQRDGIMYVPQDTETIGGLLHARLLLISSAKSSAWLLTKHRCFSILLRSSLFHSEGTSVTMASRRRPGRRFRAATNPFTLIGL